MTDSKNKTVTTGLNVTQFIRGISSPQKRKDCEQLSRMLTAATGKRAKMWGSDIVGFDEYHYKYASGREGDMCLIGYSPRASNLTVYIVPGFDAYHSLLDRLGKYKNSKSCLYIQNLDDVNLDVLNALFEQVVTDMRAMYPK